MSTLSPFTQRVVAVGMLLLLMLLGLQAISTIYGIVSSELTDLATSRAQLARLNAINAAPAPPRHSPIPKDLYLADPARAEALTHFGRLIDQAAKRVELPGVTTSPVPQTRSNVHRLELAVQAVGPTDAVQAFIYEVERTRPTIRFHSIDMSLSPTGEQLSLTAVATSVWVAGG